MGRDKPAAGTGMLCQHCIVPMPSLGSRLYRLGDVRRHRCLLSAPRRPGLEDGEAAEGPVPGHGGGLTLGTASDTMLMDSDGSRLAPARGCTSLVSTAGTASSRRIAPVYRAAGPHCRRSGCGRRRSTSPGFHHRGTSCPGRRAPGHPGSRAARPRERDAHLLGRRPARALSERGRWTISD